MGITQMRAIPKYQGYYADENGCIYSTRSGYLHRLIQQIHKGYYYVHIRQSEPTVRWVKFPVHQLILFAYVGERPADKECRHLNGNALDNRLDNLCWGTKKENSADTIRHGTAACLRHGERAIAAKLSNKQVEQIRSLHSQGYKQIDIAKRFSISQHHVSDIVNYRTRQNDRTV